jgi:hypothetical protein
MDFSNAMVVGAVRYLSDCNDGLQMEKLCIGGGLHVVRMLDRRPGDRAFVSVDPCDGSCQSERRVRDLRELHEGFRQGRYQTRSGRIIRNPVHLDGLFRGMLRGGYPLAAILFEKGYCKRFSQWEKTCIGGVHHVEATTDFTWARSDEGGFTHSVRTSPCDGSCRPQHVELTRTEIRQLFRDIRNGCVGSVPYAPC